MIFEAETEYRFWRRSNPIMWGVLGSAVVAILAISLGASSYCKSNLFLPENCERKAFTFWNSPPNEIGDTLAGLAGTLAFLWIIVTVWLQSQELREQRKELHEQRKATQDMAEAMSSQAAFLLEELENQRQSRSVLLLDERLRSLIEATHSVAPVVWRFRRKVGAGATEGTIRLIPSPHVSIDGDEQLKYVFEKILGNFQILNEMRRRKSITEYPKEIGELERFLDQMRVIEEMREKLPPEHDLRLKRLRFLEALDALNKVLEQELWLEQPNEASS